MSAVPRVQVSCEARQLYRMACYLATSSMRGKSFPIAMQRRISNRTSEYCLHAYARWYCAARSLNSEVTTKMPIILRSASASGLRRAAHTSRLFSHRPRVYCQRFLCHARQTKALHSDVEPSSPQLRVPTCSTFASHMWAFNVDVSVTHARLIDTPIHLSSKRRLPWA